MSTSAKNTERTSQFSAGQGLMASGSGGGAGGSVTKRTFPVQSGGEAFNKGRLKRGAKEVHYNKGTVSIPQGSTNPSR